MEAIGHDIELLKLEHQRGMRIDSFSNPMEESFLIYR